MPIDWKEARNDTRVIASRARGEVKPVEGIQPDALKLFSPFVSFTQLLCHFDKLRALVGN